MKTALKEELMRGGECVLFGGGEKRSSCFTSEEEVRQLKTNRGLNMNVRRTVICFFILCEYTLVLFWIFFIVKLCCSSPWVDSVSLASLRVSFSEQTWLSQADTHYSDNSSLQAHVSQKCSFFFVCVLLQHDCNGWVCCSFTTQETAHLQLLKVVKEEHWFVSQSSIISLLSLLLSSIFLNVYFGLCVRSIFIWRVNRIRVVDTSQYLLCCWLSGSLIVLFWAQGQRQHCF